MSVKRTPFVKDSPLRTPVSGTAMEKGCTFAWRGDHDKLVTVNAVRKWSTLSPEESDEIWRYLGPCEESGLGMFRHRTGETRFRTGPCPPSTKEPGPSETTKPPKKETAAPMAQKTTVPKVKAPAPTAPKATGTTKPAAKPIPVNSEPAS